MYTNDSGKLYVTQARNVKLWVFPLLFLRKKKSSLLRKSNPAIIHPSCSFRS
jgi:hypothetical protein